MFLINPYILSSSALDADAQAFITTASITDPTQQSAINQLVLDLKGYSIWSKIKALYPFVGGNSTSHSYNLINTSNYQLTFNGGWTHSSTGALPNGTNAYANTGFNNNTEFSAYNNMSLGYYSRTNSVGVLSDIGDSISTNIYFYTILSGSTGYFKFVAPESSITVTNSQGFFTQFSDGTNTYIYKNSTSLKSFVSSTSSVGGAGNLLLSTKTTSVGFSNRELSLAYMGSSLTTTDVNNLYAAIQVFQTTLSRQV